MNLLVSLLVGQPLAILLVAACVFAAYLVLRFRLAGLAPHPSALLISAMAWTLYAIWEGLVQLLTPEANIRVDLMLIWPVLAIVSLWSLLRAFQPTR